MTDWFYPFLGFIAGSNKYYLFEFRLPDWLE
jgi:hypothetical protein